MGVGKKLGCSSFMYQVLTIDAANNTSLYRDENGNDWHEERKLFRASK